MKFDFLSPGNGNGDLERPEEIEERPLAEMVTEFSNLRECDRWKNRRRPPKKQKIILGKKVKEAVTESLKEEMPKGELAELSENLQRIRRKPGQLGRTMDLSEWILTLEPIEQAYARECFRFWNGTNGGAEPSLPRGMSKAKADILRYHCKNLNNEQTGKRKVEAGKPRSFRWTDKFYRQLAFEASELDVPLSEYIRRCVNAGRPIVLAYPTLSKIFEDPCLRSDPLEETENPRGEGRGK